MARHFSVQNFFRQIPNELLARYFSERGLFDEVDFPSLKETKPTPLFDAWKELPQAQRPPIEAECQEIFEMSSEKGARAIVDEGRWQMREDAEAAAAFVELMSSQPNHYYRAMLTFLDYRDCWNGATRFFHADSLPYWRKRKHLGHCPAAVDDASLAELAIQLRDYFHHKEGRGHNCVIEPFRRGDLDYFFAYPEDYSQQSIEWIDGEFDRRPHNPAFEVIFIYSQEEGSLDINYRGDKKTLEPLQAIFASAILKLDMLPPDPKDERVYDLNPLGRADFEFSFDTGSGIEQVFVKKLRLSSRIKGGERLTLEAGTQANPKGIYELLEKVGRSIPLRHFNVTQIELSASVVVDPDKPARTIPIRVTHPNSCSLKYDVVGLKLRDMLEASGIEPKTPDSPEVDGS